MANNDKYDDDDIIGWFTVSGKHTPIHKGESKQDAYNKAIAEHNENKKKSDIEKYDAERERLTKAESVSSDTNGFKSTNSKQFSKDVENAKSSRDVTDRWRVDVHKPKDYDERKCKCYTNKYGSTVAVDSEGDIISVCKHADDPTRGMGAKLLQKAIANGGVKLDSFGGNHKFYTDNGFAPISWTPFSVKYAPDGWDKSGCKPEAVIFYAYVGKGKVKYTGLSGLHKWLSETKPFEGDSGYDNAKKYRDEMISKYKK